MEPTMSLERGRSAMFETFLKPSPKDRSQSSSQFMSSFASKGSSSLMLERALLTDPEEYEVRQEPTLWMSCSPGRDSSSSDNDAEERLTMDFVESDDEDDELPSSQMKSRRMFKDTGSQSSDDQRLEGMSSLKSIPKPKMPVSAYALFYNDAKAAIVGENPKAKFSKIAQIVATMWDHLDEEAKVDYKRKARTERRFSKRSTTCQESSPADPYTQIKRRERRVVQNSLDQNKEAKGRKKEESCSEKFFRKDKIISIADDNSKRFSPDLYTQIKRRVRNVVNYSLDQYAEALDQYTEEPQGRKKEESWSEKFSRKDKIISRADKDTKVDLTVLCRRPDCLNVAVDNPRWSHDYCSSQCVVKHSKDVFNAWVSERQGISETCESYTQSNIS